MPILISYSPPSSSSPMNWSFHSASPAGDRRRSIGVHVPRVNSPRQGSPLLAPSDGYDQDLAYINHTENLTRVRRMLARESERLPAMVMADSLKSLCVDYHFSDEIDRIVSTICTNSNGRSSDLFDVTLSFKLLREAGHDVSSDMLARFTNKNGEFEPCHAKDIRGLLSLHDASHLNMGEEILYKANEFSSRQLKLSMKHLEPNLATFVRKDLQHPHHRSLQQYRARYHLGYLQRLLHKNFAIQELAATEFRLNKLLHQKELERVTRWWRDLGLAQELPFARDQVQKWYMWSMAILQGPRFSKHRVELTKAISFIYIVDDIFDLIGTPEELSLFTECIKKWDHSATDSLPNYMRSCCMALFATTNEVAEMVAKEHGFNPIHYLQRAWVMLFEAFNLEGKWFAAGHVPAANDYLRNGLISSSVHLMLVHAFFLLGEGVTKDTMKLINSNPPLISNAAKILRLWDDLGSAEDEGQGGYDGSYMECYMKEHPECSPQSAKQHMKNLISDAWEELNLECFSRRSFSPHFIQASLNIARMVSVMYTYDEGQRLPVLEEYMNVLLYDQMN